MDLRRLSRTAITIYTLVMASLMITDQVQLPQRPVQVELMAMQPGDHC